MNTRPGTATPRPSVEGPRRRVRVSVAVCTFRRPERALRAVRSLSEQTDPAEEILVIDNDPESLVHWPRLQDVAASARLIHERTPGLNFARNRALREATGEVVIFLDDDAVAAPDWVAAMRGVFVTDPAVGVCTGRVEALALETEGQRTFEANGGFSRGPARIQLPRDAELPLHGRRAPLIAWAVSMGSGNSFAVRRELALGLGGFDVALDMGQFLPAGGDHDMVWRVLAAGRRVVYEPAALAWHDHRAELADVYDQIAGHQRGLIAMLVKTAWTGPGSSRGRVVAFIIWRLFKPLIRVARRLMGRDPLPIPVLLKIWWSCWRALGAYPRARRQARLRQGLATHA